MAPARSRPEHPAIGGAARPSGIAIPVNLPVPIGRLRRCWDLAAALHARPHVTVLYPFLPEVELTASVRDELSIVVRDHDPFELSFETVRRFDGLV